MEDAIVKANLKELENIIQKFFEKTNFLVEIKSLSAEKETIFLKLKSEEPKILIGRNGNTLSKIQHLLKLILKKNKMLENFFLDIDVNDYKERKSEYLREIAREAADRVALIKKEKILEPMLAYERRIIHLELAQRPDVVTESVGREPERRVVIKPRV